MVQQFEAPVIYIKDYFKKFDFEYLDNKIQWEQRDAPRSEAYYATQFVPYTYGRGAGSRTYKPFPNELLGQKFNDELWPAKMELLFCNRYADQHQHLGWHADDSPAIDVTRPIIVMSFGAEREIWFKKIVTDPVESGVAGSNAPAEVEKLILGHGSMLVMKAGMQQTHQHRIPKHSAPCGPRISLTYRGLAPGFEAFHDTHD